MSLLLEARNIGKVFRGGNRLFGERTETMATTKPTSAPRLNTSRIGIWPF
mgnify:CR=1 FL=1